jgi:hypothetical protein
LLLVVTSMVMIAQLSVSDMASAREGNLTPVLKEGTCRPALTHADHLWHAAVHHPLINPLPGSACRETGLSRGSYPGIRQSITRGPMEALFRHHFTYVHQIFSVWGSEPLFRSPG